jgi:hypothetical protein
VKRKSAKKSNNAKNPPPYNLAAHEYLIGIGYRHCRESAPECDEQPYDLYMLGDWSETGQIGSNDVYINEDGSAHNFPTLELVK